MGIGSWFSGLTKGIRQTGSLIQANAATATSAKATFGELLGVAKGTGEAIGKNAGKTMMNGHRGLQTSLDAITNGGEFFKDAAAHTSAMNTIKEALGDVGRDSAKDIAQAQRTIRKVVNDAGRSGGLADGINGYTDLMNKAGISFQNPGKVKGATEMFNASYKATTDDYIGGWLQGTMTDGTINRTAGLVRKGAVIGGGAIIGSSLAGATGGDNARSAGVVAGGAGAAIAANMIGRM